MNEKEKRITAMMAELASTLKKRDTTQVELDKLNKLVEAKQVELGRALPKAQQTPKPAVAVKPQSPTV